MKNERTDLTIGIRQRRIGENGQLNELIREEENSRELRLERQHFFDFIIQQIIPASVQFIARFRMKRANLVDSTMLEQQLNCTICLSDFQLDEHYEQWPCPSSVPHRFHFNCMLNILRRQNTCPICRHPVEIDQRSNQSLGRFFNRLVF